VAHEVDYIWVSVLLFYAVAGVLLVRTYQPAVFQVVPLEAVLAVLAIVVLHYVIPIQGNSANAVRTPRYSVTYGIVYGSEVTSCVGAAM
jgi:hypothetical protein